MNPWPVYVISMRPEFWARIEAQGRNIGLPLQRWEATDGKSIDLAAWKRDGLFEPPLNPAERQMTRGELGCSHSHQRIWSHARIPRRCQSRHQICRSFFQQLLQQW